jgi:ribosomal peptide maturation radical SAM protein 1
MYRISFVNMPFAELKFPSIALTQLKSVLDEQFAGKVSVRVHYLNQNCAHYLGLRLYADVADSVEATTSGLGDWLFKKVAFPDAADDVDAYFQRFFLGEDAVTAAKRQLFLRKRKGIDLFLDRIITTCQLDKDDLVGFTSMFSQNVPSFALASKLKQRNPNIVTVVGGANCETPMGQVIAQQVKDIDYVFSGPGLKSFSQFMEHQLRGEKGKCSEIKGVFSKTFSNLGLSSANAIGEETDINRPIHLDYRQFLESLGDNFSRADVDPTLLFETSRGCWWGQKSHCTFCGLNGTTMAYRSMEPAHALEQFDRLFNYADRCSRFDAVDNILPKNYLTDVLPQLHPPKNIKMFYEVKADLTAAEMETLAKAGVRLIQPGVESLNTSTLKRMKKGTTAFQNINFLKHCVTYGVQPGWNLLIGFPGEEGTVYEKYVRDIPRLVHLPPPSGAYPVRFDRYSPYFTRAKEYGLDLLPMDFYNFVYPFDADILAGLAYHFKDCNYDAPYITVMTEWVSRIRERIDAWRLLWISGKMPPSLTVSDIEDGVLIRDSRSGEMVEYELRGNSAELLRYLAAPKAMTMIVKELAHLPNFDAQKELDVLENKILIFAEEGRFLSLVLSQQPAFMKETKIDSVGVRENACIPA